MNQAELLDYIDAQITPLVTAEKIRLVLKEIVNSVFSQQIQDIIPLWTNALTFKLDGSSAGLYAKNTDTNNRIRLWETKVDNNIGNEPPTNPVTTENTYWKEVSPSSSSALQEWSPGLFGSGLVIVYHNHSDPDIGKWLYILTEPSRPFNSTNIESEITAGKWAPIPAYGSTGGGGTPTIDNSVLLENGTDFMTTESGDYILIE